jgi:hypothetical protein
MYEEEINSYDASISINNETMNVKQISIKLTDGYLKKILERTLKKIKNDPKAKLILSNVYPEFLEIEVDENKEYLKKNENYTFNIYVRKFWYQPIKYELVHILEDDQETYTYEGNKETGVFYYSKNNEAKYTAKVASSEKMIEILVFDSKNTAVGSIKLEKSKNSVSCNTNLNLEERVIDISYSSVYKNYVKNTSYLKEDKLTLRIMNQDSIVLNGNIQIDSNINKKVTINEDIENSILKSTISDEQEDKLKHLKDNVKNRLERE